MNRVESTLSPLAAQASHVLQAYLELTHPVIRTSAHTQQELVWTLNQLNICCHLSSESALLLVAHVRLWDAEMLVRSIFEGTLKLAFLCMGDEQERAQRLDEYSNVLPDISKIKRHQRVQPILESPDFQHETFNREPLEALVLSDEELKQLQDKYPRKSRQQLEQKWSFFEIAQALAKPQPEMPPFDAATLLAYSYGMSSHQLHKDADAVMVVWDRVQRSDARREALEMAHAGREIADVLCTAMLRAWLILKIHGVDTKQVSDLYNSHQMLFDSIDKMSQEWWSIESSHLEEEA